MKTPINTLWLIGAGLALAACSQSPQKTADAPPPAHSAPAEPRAIIDARLLAAKAIHTPSSDSHRLPAFLTWATRADMQPCPAPNAPPRDSKVLRGDVDAGVHARATTAVDAPLNDVKGFYYNEQAVARLCQTILRDGPTVPSPQGNLAPPVVMSGQVDRWMQWAGKAQKPIPASIDAFPAGARAGVAIWQELRRNKTAKLQLQTFADSGRPDGAYVSVAIPESVLQAGMSSNDVCNAPLPAYGTDTPPQDAVPLNDLFWLQLNKQDQVNHLHDCGDILVLVGFHLIEKVATSPETPAGGDWLWSTYWWDDKDTKRPHLARQPDGAGNPEAWTHYVVQATYRSDEKISNPWKDLEPVGSNCASCHHQAYFPGGGSQDFGISDLKPIPGKLHADFIFAGPKRPQVR